MLTAAVLEHLHPQVDTSPEAQAQGQMSRWAITAYKTEAGSPGEPESQIAPQPILELIREGSEKRAT